MDAEVLVAQKMADNSGYDKGGLRSREQPNQGMQVIIGLMNILTRLMIRKSLAKVLHTFQTNSLLHTVVVIYRFVVVFLDLASFWFK